MTAWWQQKGAQGRGAQPGRGTHSSTPNINVVQLYCTVLPWMACPLWPPMANRTVLYSTCGQEIPVFQRGAFSAQLPFSPLPMVRKYVVPHAGLGCCLLLTASAVFV